MSLCAKFHTFVPICAMVQLTALTRKKSSVLVLSPERSGIRVGSDINCDRSFTMAKASASRLARLVICGEVG